MISHTLYRSNISISDALQENMNLNLGVIVFCSHGIPCISLFRRHSKLNENLAY